MKSAIYVRTSTTEQHPEKQEKECITFSQSRGYEVEGIYQEQISAFKKVERPVYELLKQKAYRGEINAVVVWALDRWVRNRDTLLEDVTLLKGYGCKLHSVKDSWLESINIEGPLGKSIQEFLLGIVGSMAQMESQLKSERIRMAYLNHNGRKWGRRSLPDRAIADIKQLHGEGKSIRQISNTVTYYDKNKNLKKVSIGAVHKTLSGKGLVFDT